MASRQKANGNSVRGNGRKGMRFVGKPRKELEFKFAGNSCGVAMHVLSRQILSLTRLERMDRFFTCFI